MKVSQHVTMLSCARERGALYPAVLMDANEALMVDTGFPMMIDVIQAALKEDGLAPEQLTGIVFTHQDIDHIGCAKELLALAPKAKTYAHELEAPYIDGGKTPQKLALFEANIGNMPPEAKQTLENMRAGFANRRIPIDEKLTDGQVLPLCGGVEVIHTPGHTHGHICLHVKQDHVLIAGDQLSVADGVLRGPNPQHTPDMPAALLGVKKLMGRGIQTIVCYHGGLFQGNADAALEAILKNH